MSTVGSVGKADGSKRCSSSSSAGARRRCARPDRAGERGAHLARATRRRRCGRRASRRRGAWPGARRRRRARAARGRSRRRQPQPGGDVQLARRRLDEIRAAHDLPDPGSCVVDDHGEIVCRDAVVAAYDQIVDDALAAAEQAVGERDGRRAGAQAQRGRAPRRLARGALGARQLAAGPGVGAVRAARRAAPTPPGGSRRACRSRGTGRRRRPAARSRRRSARRRSDWRTTGPSQSRPSAARSASCCSATPGRTRPRSRSSMRMRKRAPCERANSHASSAVRRLPRCSVPVGDGA